MKKFNVIILARGGKGPLHKSHSCKNKALLEIHGKPMLDWVVEAFAQSDYIDNIIVLGTEELDKLSSMRYVNKRIPSGLDVVQDIIHGVTYLSTFERKQSKESGYLIANADTVFLTREAIDKALENISQSQADVNLHYVEESTFNKNQTDLKESRSYIKIGDKSYAQTAIYHIKNFHFLRNFIAETVELRANLDDAQALVKVIGAQNAQSLDEVRDLLAAKIKTSVSIFESTHVELAMDIYDEHDLRLAERYLENPWKHQYKKAKLIYNPQAARGRQMSPFFKKMLGIKYRKFEVYKEKEQYITKIKEYLNSYGIDVEAEQTQSQDHATQIAKDCVKQGFDLVIAAGGDGTVNEVVNGLVNSDVVLGVIPMGTANVFSIEIDLPMEIKAVCQVIAQGNTRKIDLGKVNDRHFICMAGIGFDAYILKKSDSKWKKIYGALAYIFIGIWNLCTYKFKKIIITIDDQPVPKKGYFLVVGNGKCYGGDMSFTSQASLDDGYLDICLFRHKNIPAIFNYLLGINKGNVDKHLIVDYFKCKKIVIDKNGSHPIHIDAEYICDTPAEITVCPASLNVVV